jgi:hypothetical protein
MRLDAISTKRTLTTDLKDQWPGKSIRPTPTPLGGGVYAPFVIERFTKVHDHELDLYYVMSTWNPYVVVLMKSRIMIQ